jgi:hypothetical protein
MNYTPTQAKALAIKLGFVNLHAVASGTQLAELINAAGISGHARDAERLDFVLQHWAFVMESTSDAGVKLFQLMEMDEDENMVAISGKTRFFSTPREATDAAISAQEPKG